MKGLGVPSLRDVVLLKNLKNRGGDAKGVYRRGFTGIWGIKGQGV